MLVQIFAPITTFSDIFTKSDQHLLQTLNQSAIDHAAILTHYRRLVSVGVLIMWIKILKYIIYVEDYKLFLNILDFQSAQLVPRNYNKCRRVHDFLPHPPHNGHTVI